METEPDAPPPAGARYGGRRATSHARPATQGARSRPSPHPPNRDTAERAQPTSHAKSGARAEARRATTRARVGARFAPGQAVPEEVVEAAYVQSQPMSHAVVGARYAQPGAPTPRWTSLREWGIRPKLIIVLSIPTLAALSLGGVNMLHAPRPPTRTGPTARSSRRCSVVSAASDLPAGQPAVDASGATMSVKIVVAGGFGVGKTTFVGSVSEIVPLTTEGVMTEAGQGHDDVSILPNKRTTTVAMDFGRISLDEDLILYLFGTPGQQRFWFMWDDLVRGAIGAVVLIDSRRLADSFAAVDYFEERRLPFIVGLNRFDGIAMHTSELVREALGVSDDVPMLDCDARDRASVKEMLIHLVERALASRSKQPRLAHPSR